MAALLLTLGGTAKAQQDVTQPGDPIIASSSNGPGTEGVANAIDGQPTKYLNFDTRTGGKPSGFVVTPSVGVTRVTGISMQSANDEPDRDPKIITLEGSNDETIADFASGTWDLIVRLDNVPAYTARFQTQTFSFANVKPYKHYRWTVVETQTVNGCCMQIAEVELLGSTLPQDVTQPGDPVIASSSNSPGTEGVANAIDGQPTKYLNFDTRTGGKPSGLIVSPSIGRTLVTGLTLQSANDEPDRDPKVLTLEGSNDETVSDFVSGNWEQIVRFDDIAPYTARFQTQTLLFDNYKPYRHYRLTVLETQTINGCCFQIAEIEFLGTGAPQDVTQPGDPIIASSSNGPGTEGVANAIDGQPTKYLNFDTRTGGKPSGFVVSPSIGATTVIGLTMQSANDEPDRDPKVVTLEGSNDDTIADFASGTWTLVARLENIPAYTARFETQEFYFTNTVAYKHYRWTVLETQTINGCCMQIAEVELLAVTASVPCDQARFLVQPTDTPALNGAPATFVVGVNGPWPLQWYKNGTAIPGASTVTYTTEPVTPENTTNVYTVEIKGCEFSTPVRALVFTPSTTKSIGIHFRGGGANGTPTVMETNDIAGVHLQAHWVNNQRVADDANSEGASTGSIPDESFDPPSVMVDSDNNPSSITLEYTTSGRWGAGTGEGTPTQRLLNGLLYAAPVAVGADPSATLTFANVPAGSHSVIVYMVDSPLQVRNANYKIAGQSQETYYVRVINADEYNAAPGFYRGSSKDPAVRDLATYVRFDNVQADASGNITLSWETVTTGFDRGAPVNAVQLLLNATAPPPAPTITAQPQPTAGRTNSSVHLSVTATGDGNTYQWRKNGRNLPNGGNISGATTASLSIAAFGEDDEGVYSVAVFNAGGSVVSRNAAVQINNCDIKDALVGYWKFDETTGTSAANAVAGGKPATVTGASGWAAGQIANGFGFDGATYLLVADYPIADRQLSVSGWVTVPAGTSGDVAFARNAQGQIGLGTGVAPNTPAGQFEIGLVANADTGEIRLSAAIGAGPNIVRATAPSVFPLGTWQQVAFTADGAQLRLYINGAQVASTDYSSDLNRPDVPYISIGARLNQPADSPLEPDASAPNFMPGRIDDVGVWTRSLAASELAEIYAAGQQAKALDTVVEDCGAEAPEVTIARSGGNVTVTWTAGKLQSASSVTGTWTDVVGNSPLTEAATDAAKYYRAVVP